MKNNKKLICAIVIGAAALYLYRRNKQKSYGSLSISEIADINTNKPNSISGETVTVNTTRSSYVDCYTDSKGQICCRNRRTGDIFCGTNLTR